MEQKNRPKPCMERQLIKMRAEINELETRSTVERSTKLEAGSLKELIRLINPWPPYPKEKRKDPNK